MVSNWLPSISRSRWGNSTVTTPPALSSRAIPATKLLRSGTWASTLLAAIRSAWRPAVASSTASCSSEKGVRVGTPGAPAAPATVGAGLNPQPRPPPGHEVLKQVAVVAGQLHDQAVRAQPEPLGGHLGVVAGVPHPGVGVRGEVGVLGEDRPRGHIRLELHQPALLADVGPQRVEGLHLVELVGGQERLAQGRAPEVAHHPRHRRRAEAARVGDRSGLQSYSAALRLRSAGLRSVTSEARSPFSAAGFRAGAGGRGLNGTVRAGIGSSSSSSASAGAAGAPP